MSVFIEDYCKEHQNDLAQRLQALQDEGVLIGSDELEIVIVDNAIIVSVYIDHTITCCDVGEIEDVLDDVWWRFHVCYGRPGYYLSFCPRAGML